MITRHTRTRTYSPQAAHHSSRQHIARLPDLSRRKFFQLQYLCHQPKIDGPKEAAKCKRRDQLASHRSRTLEIATINLCPDSSAQIANPNSIKHSPKIHTRALQANDSQCQVAAKRLGIHSSKCERRMRPNSSLSDSRKLDFPSKQDAKSRSKLPLQAEHQCGRLAMQDETIGMTINPVCYSNRPAWRRQPIQIPKEQLHRAKDVESPLKSSRIRHLRKQAKPVRPWSPDHQAHISFQFQMVTLS